jgi:hypothetical protein
MRRIEGSQKEGPILTTKLASNQARHDSGAHKSNRFAKRGPSFRPAGALDFRARWSPCGGAMDLKDLSDVRTKNPR